MLSICTRSRIEDYQFKGDVYEYNNFKKCITPFRFLIDTSKPLVILYGNDLLVTGIATSRRDKVETPIRYSIFYSGDKSKSLFPRFQAALGNDSAKSIGEELDDLLGIKPTTEILNFHIPTEEIFLNCIEAKLPTSSSHTIENFALWSVFCPTDKDVGSLKTFLKAQKSNLPKSGSVEVDGVGKIDLLKLSEKKTEKSQKIGCGKLIFLNICSLLLGILGTKFTETYMHPMEREAKQIPVKMHQDTMSRLLPTGLIVLMEEESAQLPEILRERQLKKVPQYPEIRIMIQQEAQDTKIPVLLVPVASLIENQKISPTTPIPLLCQKGPLVLSLISNKQKQDTQQPVQNQH